MEIILYVVSGVLIGVLIGNFLGKVDNTPVLVSLLASMLVLFIALVFLKEPEQIEQKQTEAQMCPVKQLTLEELTNGN